jgi:23S rRNA (uracil1939-C5)-methyltransferase
VSEPVRIRAIAAGGDGVGTLTDGRTVFVPRSAPGDLLELTALTMAKRFARGRIARVLEPSTERVAPPCPHYQGDDCGSCQLQHLGEEAQRRVRAGLVSDALERIGRLPPGPVPLTPSDSEWEYRTKITLAVRGRTIGYHRVGRPDLVFDLISCPLARPELNQLWTALRSHRSLLPPNAAHLVLRVDRGGGLHLVVKVTGSDVWLAARELGQALAKRGVHAVLWWQPAEGAPRTVFGSREAFPATVFEQVHPAMGDMARAHAIEALGPVRGIQVWDLYAGIGETTRALAERGAMISSVELDRRAVALADSRGPAEGIVRHAGRVEDLLPRLPAPGAIVVNPPRTGLGDAVTGFLGQMHSDPASGPDAGSPGALVYISCDPATLARDVARLRPRWRVDSVRAFDLFPQTAHIETVLRMVPA